MRRWRVEIKLFGTGRVYEVEVEAKSITLARAAACRQEGCTTKQTGRVHEVMT